MNNDTMDLTIKMREKLLDKIIAELTASEKEEMNTKQNRYLHTQDLTTKTPEKLLSKFITELTASEKEEMNTKHNRYVNPYVNIQDVTIKLLEKLLDKLTMFVAIAMMNIAIVPMKAMKAAMKDMKTMKMMYDIVKAMAMIAERTTLEAVADRTEKSETKIQNIGAIEMLEKLLDKLIAERTALGKEFLMEAAKFFL